MTSAGGISVKREMCSGHAGRDRSDKVPKRDEAVNDRRETELSQGEDKGPEHKALD